MNRSIITTPSSKRVFGACLLSFMLLLAPIASVGAATRGAIVPRTVENKRTTESLRPSLVEPAAAMPAPAPVPAPAPMLAVGPITATKSDSFPDPDGDGKAELGETISYTIGISNTGTDPATGVNFDDIYDANTTLVPGSLNVSPLAIDESYTAVGNTLLEVGNATAQTGPQKSVAGGVLSNGDTDYLGDTFTISTFDATSAFGGTVTMVTTGPDAGAFTYISAANYTGPDSFTYTLRDDGTDGIPGNSDDLTGIGTVTITVANQVWYVDNAAAAGGDGRSTTPFDALSDVSGASGPDTAGDIIYINTGIAAYTGGIALLGTQTLHGEGTALVVGGDTLAAAGTDPTITNAAGSGVTLLSGNTLTGFTVGNTTVADVTDGGGTVGTLNISNVTLTGTGAAVDIDQGGTLAVTFDSIASSGAGQAIDLGSTTGVSGSFTVSGTTTIDDAIADGIAISNSSVTATFTGALTILNDGGANGDGVDLSTNTGTYSFNGGTSITVNGAGAFGFRAQSSGTVNIVDVGTTQITSNAGTALLINPTTLNATLDTITSGGGADGISLTSMSGSLTVGSVSINGQTVDGIDITNSAGSVTINGGSIGNTNDPAGAGVDISGGAGNVTISATINKTTAGDVVEVTGRTGGTVDFNALLTSTAAAGVDLTGSTGGTVRFDGGMTLSTGAAIAFNSTGNTGMTLVVTDPGGLGVGNDNTLTTTTGIALNVANTTIGAEDLNFRSISANGASSGIVLNTTGSSGNLLVSGNGGACTSTATCTGGAIQNTTSHGILLTSTSHPSFTRVAIQNTSGSGIEGTTVTDFTLQNSFIDNSGTGGTADDSNVAFNNQASGTENNISGTVTITNNILTNARWHGIMIQNFSGTVADAIVTGNTITSGTTLASSLGYGINFQILGAAANVSHLTKANISTNTITNFPSAGGIQVQGGNSNAAGPTGTVGVAGNATNVISITSNLIRGQSAANRMNTSAILYTVSGKGTGNVAINNNGTLASPLAHTTGTTIGVGANGNTTLTALTNGNFIESNHPTGMAATAISGGSGITFGVTDTANMTWTINNNTIRNSEGNGILAVARGNNGTLNVTIKNNDVEAPMGGVRPGIRVDAGNGAVGEIVTVCVDIANNISAGSGVSAGIGIRKESASTFGIEGLAPSPATGPQAELFIEGLNPAGNGVDNISTSGGDGTNYTSCSAAPLMFNPDPVAFVTEPIRNNASDSLVSFLDSKDVFASIFDRLNAVAELAQALPATDGQLSMLTAEAGITGVISESNEGIAFSKWLGSVAKSAARFAGSVDSLMVPSAHAETEKPEVRTETSEARTETARTSMPRGDIRLNHAPSRRTSVAKNSTSTSAPLAPMPPLTTVSIGTLPGNKSLTIVFQVTVNTTGLGSATSVSNQGTVSGTNFANVLTDDQPGTAAPNEPTVTPISRLDVQVTKTDGVTSTTPGSDLTYVLTYTNNDHAANGVVLTETVPVGTTFKAAGSDTWTGCADGAPAGTVCTISLGNLPRFNLAGHTGTRTFVVTVLNPAPAGQTDVINTATIASDGTYEPDYIPANNTTTDTDTLNAAPDLNISKTDGVLTTTPGSTLTYTINYSNVGTQNAAGVVLTETVPVGTTFTTTGSSAWTGCANGAPAGTVCTINVGNLTAGAPAASATFAVVVTNPAASGLTSISNTATIADDGTNGTDPNLANNTTNDTDTLDATPDMTISKVANVPDVAPGETIVYTITYANTFNQNATGVVITETVPTHTTFSTADSAPTVWSCADNSPAGTVCTTTIGAVAGGGAGGTVKFGVVVDDPVPPVATQISNTATIADDGGNGADPNPSNNTTGAVITPILVCTPPPANLTNWWTGDNTARDIAGGKDGTLTNGATATGTGKVLQGFSLDGSVDYVDIGDVDFTTDKFTIDAWINPTNLTNEQAIVNKDSGVDRSYFFNVTSTGALRALVHSGGGNFTQYQTAAGVVTAGSLQHVAVTYDGAAAANAKMLFYKNGVLVASIVQLSQDAGGTPENVALAARIGRSNDGTSAFIGVIDELEFFSRVLSASELLAIFTADSGGKCKPPDLRITKTHTDPFVQGSSGNTYTITVHNDGPGTTNGTVNVLDSLPAGLTATGWSGTGWTCNPLPPGGQAGAAPLTCSRSDGLASGADFPVITLTVTAGANMASVTNTVTVSGGGQMDTSDDTANDLTNLTPSSDLLSVKVDSPDPVTASTNITYGITLTNNGPSDAQTVTLTDAVPANTTFVSFVQNTVATFSCTSPSPGGTGNVSCSLATLATGASATFTMLVNVNANTPEGTVITNNAVATTTTNDPVPGNNTGTAMTTVRQSDIEITSKTDTPDPVNAGENITYTVNFKNNSAFNTASNVTVTDAVPTGTTLVSATTASSGWARTDALNAGDTGNIVFSKALVAASETAVFTIVVKVNANVASGSTITNTATAATTSVDTVSANNSASATTTTATSADLAITSKTDAPDPVLASQNITYAINFVNNGPSDAQTVTVTDAVPTGTTFVSASVTSGSGWTIPSPPAVGGTGNVVFSKATVAAAETAVFEVVVKVNNNAVEGSTITNDAVAASATTDPTPGNNTGTATTTVNQSDIEITSKTDTPDPVEAGSNITYTVNFKNNSAVSTASNVTVTDAVPTGTTLVSATTLSPGWARTDALNAGDTGNIVFSKALVAASETAVFTIVVKVSTSVTSGTIVTNTATAATTSLDTVSANNSATATTTVVVNADLAVTSKTDTPDPVTASQNITYAINFVNNGPSDAQTVTVTDAVPAGTTFVSASVTSGSSWTIPSPPAVGGTGNVVFSKATVAVAETATFEVVVKVNNNAVEGSIITNNAVAAGSTNDPTPGNNTGTATTTVRQSDIEITSKTDTPDPVTAGENITYTVNFKNNSAFNTASNVTVTDAVPTGTTLVSATTASAGWARTDAVPAGGTGNIVFSKALVAVSETATFTIVVKVNANVLSGTTITNTATAATTSIDTNSANNSAGATTTTAASADLQITSKTDAPDPVTAGENITYTINFINNGPSDAQTVTVTDAVPTNTTFVSASVTSGTGWTMPSPPAVGGTGNVVFSKATVAAAETATFQVVVKVNSNTPAATIISNDAVAASATTDPTPANNTGNATTTVVTSADLLVVKVDSPDPVVAGQNLTYTITVTNGGASDAQNLSLSDTLPPNTTFVSFTVPAGWTRTDAVPVGGTGTVTATAPTLISGASAVFTLVVNVNSATPHNTVLTNSATATSTTTDPNPVNNTGTVMTTVVSQPDLTITKTHSGNFAQGQVGATYTITVSNSGSGPTNGSTVTVTDNVPVGLTPTGPVGAHNGWTCSIVGQQLTCTRSDVLAGNSSYPSITLTVNVANPAPATVTNTATVSGVGEVNTSNNTASDPTNIDCTSDFSLNNTNPLMISRFRMNGPAGTQDEFVEIFNPGTTDHTVASGNCGGGGYGVFASAGNGTNSNNVSMVCFIPNGTVIPAGGYYLCTGATYSLSNLGRNGGAEGATSVSDAPIGCGGSCTADIPDDAGLGLMNVAQGVTLSPGGGFIGGVPDAGFILYDKVGFGPYGAGAPAPLYPSLAGNFCEGGACLKPVGDASTSGTCTNPSGLFPVISVPPACYGLAGQYELLRRQNAFHPNLGTVHLDTNNSANDWILVAPNSAINMGIGVTGVLGVTAIHGAAGPQGSTAPADTPSTSLTQGPFGSGSTQLSAPNAERNYALDPTVVDPANNPDGTFALRLRFTNNSGNAIAGLRFRVDHISTLCGAQTGTPAVGSGSARNLAASPDCGGGGLKAILKLLNSAQEVVIDNTDTAYAIHGTVIEDLSASATPTPPGAGPLSPKGGGLDNSFIVNPSSNVASVGDGVTGGTGVFATTIGTTDADKVLRIKVKFGVVKSGRFILLFTPAAKPAP